MQLMNTLLYLILIGVNLWAATNNIYYAAFGFSFSYTLFSKLDNLKDK